MKARLALLSICSCGHPVLKTHIPTGTVYEVKPAAKMSIAFTCGGCGAHIKVPGIWAERDGVPGGFLPEQIFDIIPNQCP